MEVPDFRSLIGHHVKREDGRFIPSCLLVEFASSPSWLVPHAMMSPELSVMMVGPLQDGEIVDFKVDRIGHRRLHVRDPLKRRWEKGIYMGADSSNPEAIKRNRPQRAP